jgi:predicted transcriptional regulator of viral defense system
MALIRSKPVIRTRDFSEAGIPRNYLHRLTNDGVLVQISRGLYEAADRPLSPGGSFAEVALWSPRATIALLSALQLHELTTQAPHEIWILLGLKDWVPRGTPTSLQIVRASGEALTAGIEGRVIDGVTVRLTSPAKTIADCFKYRSKIGVNVAIEALREGLKRKIATVDQLWHYGRICRVQTLMRPYLQAMA